MMSILMEQLINITDAVFLGHVGEVELGASAIAGIYYLAVYMLGFGFSIGLQVMIARRNGEQNYALRFCFCTGKPNRDLRQLSAAAIMKLDVFSNGKGSVYYG